MNHILNRITSLPEFEKQISDYESHIKMMVGKEGHPIPLHVLIVSGDKAAPATMLGFFIGITIGHLALPKHTENEHEEKNQD